MNAANAVIDPLTASSPDGENDRPRLGRPLLMTPAQVLERIASLAREGNLFRVHHVEPGLYARAPPLAPDPPAASSEGLTSGAPAFT